MTWFLVLLSCAAAGPVTPATECRVVEHGPYAVECRAGPPRPGRPCDPGSCGEARNLAVQANDVRYAMCVEAI